MPPLDTLAAVRKLIAAGASRELAEAIVEAISQSQTELTTNAKLDLESANLKVRINEEIKDAQKRVSLTGVLAWLAIIGAGVAIIGVVFIFGKISNFWG
ncbi:MAG: hypothetical protein ACR2P7_04650 [bacterium]